MLFMADMIAYQLHCWGLQIEMRLLQASVKRRHAASIGSPHRTPNTGNCEEIREAIGIFSQLPEHAAREEVTALLTIFGNSQQAKN
jgi:hypothetical protein